MSRISAVRSTTLTLTRSSRFLQLARARARRRRSPCRRRWPATISRRPSTLPRPMYVAGSGRLPALVDRVEHLRAGGLGEQRELGHRVLGVRDRALGPDPDQDDPLEAELAVLDLGDVLELGATGRRPGAARAARRGPSRRRCSPPGRARRRSRTRPQRRRRGRRRRDRSSVPVARSASSWSARVKSCAFVICHQGNVRRPGGFPRLVVECRTRPRTHRRVIYRSIAPSATITAGPVSSTRPSSVQVTRSRPPGHVDPVRRAGPGAVGEGGGDHHRAGAGAAATGSPPSRARAPASRRAASPRRTTNSTLTPSGYSAGSCAGRLQQRAGVGEVVDERDRVRVAHVDVQGGPGPVADRHRGLAEHPRHAHVDGDQPSPSKVSTLTPSRVATGQRPARRRGPRARRGSGRRPGSRCRTSPRPTRRRCGSP